jgi:hypothetical protein
MSFTLTLAVLLSQTPTPSTEGRATETNKNAKIAVPDFQTTAGNEPLAAMLAGAVATEIDRSGLFTVTTTDQVKALLTLERQRQLLGCNDDSCTSNVAGALGVDYLVNGRLSRLVDAKKSTSTVTLDLAILEVKAGKRVSSQAVTSAGEAELVSKLTETVAKLVAPLLAGRQGFLVVFSTEDGSAVRVDGTQLGTTPMTQRLQLTGGPHVLKVEKEGFTAVQKQVRITPDQVTEEAIRLTPSPDFVEAYEKQQWAYRIGGFIGVAVAIAGFATFGIMQGQAQYAYGTGSGDQYESFLRLRNELVANESEETRRKAESAANSINTQLAVSYVAGGLGLAGAAAATVLFLIGDDPNRYQAYRGPRASAMLGPHGGHVGLAWDF